MSPDIQSKLEAIVANEDATIEPQYALVEELESLPNGLVAVEPVLRLFERHPNCDFGTPGPLAHFIERFYRRGYEEELKRSLRRYPTTHTVWLVNRVINGSSGIAKAQWVALLESVVASETTEVRARAAAKEFLELCR